MGKVPSFKPLVILLGFMVVLCVYPVTALAFDCNAATGWFDPSTPAGKRIQGNLDKCAAQRDAAKSKAKTDDSNGTNQATTASDGSTKGGDLESSFPKSLDEHCFQQAEADKLLQKARECDAAVAKANNDCDEKKSQQIAELNQALGMGIQALAQSQGANAACSGIGKLMGLANMGTIAYRQVCTASKMKCDNSCKEVEKLAQTYSNACNQLSLEATADARETEDANLKATLLAKASNASRVASEVLKVKTGGISDEKNCTGYQADIALAAVQSLVALKSMAQANNCQQATAGDQFANTDIDCTKAENANQQKCICEKDPRIAGCSALAAVGSGQTPTAGAVSLDAGNTSPTGTPDVSGLLGDENTIDAVKKKDGAGGGGPTGGGGAGLLGGGAGGGGAGGPGGPVAAQKSGNTNIFSGFGGGGGGSSSYRGNSAMKDYLPGGKKDPNRMPGSLSIPVAAQVSDKAGLSNFEKVKRTYNENRGSLLAN